MPPHRAAPSDDPVLRLHRPPRAAPNTAPEDGPDDKPEDGSADGSTHVPPGAPPASGGALLVYSETRHRRLRACPRAAYYAGHLAPAGLGAPVGSAAWLAARLRRTTTVWAAVGGALHDAAAACARAARAGGPLPTPDALRARAGVALNALWRSSRDRRAAFLARPAHVPMLAEVLYGEEPTPATLARARERLDRGVEALVGLRPLWRAVGRPGAEARVPAPFFSFTLPALPNTAGASAPDAPGRGPVGGRSRTPGLAGGAVRCYAAPDLLVRPRLDAPWHVIEFKSGRTDGSADQALTYALAAMVGFRLTPAPGPRPYAGAVVALSAPGRSGAPGRSAAPDASVIRRPLGIPDALGIPGMAAPAGPSFDVPPAHPGLTAFAVTWEDLAYAEARVRRGAEELGALAAAVAVATRTPKGAPAGGPRTAAAWRPGELPDTIAAAAPRTADPRHCPRCEFRGLCYPGRYPVARLTMTVS